MEMELETAHNFEQIAWTQLNQFNFKDLQEALNSFLPYEEICTHHDLVRLYYQNSKRRRDYIRMIYETKCYQLLEQWIMNETQTFKSDHMTQEEKSNFNSTSVKFPQAIPKKESPMPSLCSLSSDEEEFYSV